MKKINFKEFALKKGIATDDVIILDVRETFADLIYNNTSGIKALSLAQKIYKSEGLTDFDEDEIGTIMGIAEQLCTVKMLDSLNEMIKE